MRDEDANVEDMLHSNRQIASGNVKLTFVVWVDFMQ